MTFPLPSSHRPAPTAKIVKTYGKRTFRSAVYRPTFPMSLPWISEDIPSDSVDQSIKDEPVIGIIRSAIHTETAEPSEKLKRITVQDSLLEVATTSEVPIGADSNTIASLSPLAIVQIGQKTDQHYDDPSNLSPQSEQAVIEPDIVLPDSQPAPNLDHDLESYFSASIDLAPTKRKKLSRMKGAGAFSSSPSKCNQPSFLSAPALPSQPQSLSTDSQVQPLPDDMILGQSNALSPKSNFSTHSRGPKTYARFRSHLAHEESLLDERFVPIADLQRQQGLESSDDEGNGLKSVNQLKDIGSGQRFMDDLEYILDGLEAGDSSGCLSSLVELASRTCNSDFLLRIRTQGYLGRVFDALVCVDPIPMYFSLFILANLFKHSANVDALIREREEAAVQLLSTALSVQDILSVRSKNPTTRKWLDRFRTLQNSLSSDDSRNKAILSFELVIETIMTCLWKIVMHGSCLKGYSTALIVPALTQFIVAQTNASDMVNHLTVYAACILKAVQMLEHLYASDASIILCLQRDLKFPASLLHCISWWSVLSVLTPAKLSSNESPDTMVNMVIEESLLVSIKILINLSSTSTECVKALVKSSSGGLFPLFRLVIQIDEGVSDVHYDCKIYALGLLVNCLDRDSSSRTHLVHYAVSRSHCRTACVYSCQCKSPILAYEMFVSSFAKRLQIRESTIGENVCSAYMAILIAFVIKDCPENRKLTLSLLPGHSFEDTCRLLEEFGETWQSVTQGHAATRSALGSDKLRSVIAVFEEGEQSL